MCHDEGRARFIFHGSIGSVRFGTVPFGSVPSRSVRYGSVRYGTVPFGSVLFGLVRFSLLWLIGGIVPKTKKKKDSPHNYI